MTSIKALLAILCALLIIPGAGYTGNVFLEKETSLDCNWGRSYEMAKYNQILNQKAEDNLYPVAGLEGRVGMQLMENYIKKAPEQKSSHREMGILTIK